MPIFRPHFFDKGFAALRDLRIEQLRHSLLAALAQHEGELRARPRNLVPMRLCLMRACDASGVPW